MSVIVKSARGECHSTVCLGIMSKEHVSCCMYWVKGFREERYSDYVINIYIYV